MLTSKMFCAGITILVISMSIAAAQAASGNDEGVAKAKFEYEQAMKSHDVGLQNAMKIQLSVQLSKARIGKAEGNNDTNSGAKKNM